MTCSNSGNDLYPRSHESPHPSRAGTCVNKELQSGAKCCLNLRPQPQQHPQWEHHLSALHPLRINHCLLRLLHFVRARRIRPKLLRLPLPRALWRHEQPSKTGRLPHFSKTNALSAMSHPISRPGGSSTRVLNVLHVNVCRDIRIKEIHNGVPMIRVKPPAIVITSLEEVPTRIFTPSFLRACRGQLEYLW